MSPFRATTAATNEVDGFFARHVQWSEHSGTPMDAPLHLGQGVDEIPARDFLRAAAVADVRATVSVCPKDRLAGEDLKKWEQRYGAWARGRGAGAYRLGFIVAYKQKLHQSGRPGVAHFPGWSLQAAHERLKQALPRASGIDTPSVDSGRPKNWSAINSPCARGSI